MFTGHLLLIADCSQQVVGGNSRFSHDRLLPNIMGSIVDLLGVVAEFRHFAITARFKFSFLFSFFAEVLSQSLVIAIGLYVFAPSSQSDTEKFLCLLDSLSPCAECDRHFIDSAALCSDLWSRVEWNEATMTKVTPTAARVVMHIVNWEDRDMLLLLLMLLVVSVGE